MSRELCCNVAVTEMTMVGKVVLNEITVFRRNIRSLTRTLGPILRWGGRNKLGTETEQRIPARRPTAIDIKHNACNKGMEEETFEHSFPASFVTFGH